MNELKDTVNERDQQLNNLTEDNVIFHILISLPRYLLTFFDITVLANSNKHAELNEKRP